MISPLPRWCAGFFFEFEERLRKSSVLALIVLCFFTLLSPALAADAPAVMDVVTLMDGSIIYGEVGGGRQIDTATSPGYTQSLSDDVRIGGRYLAKPIIGLGLSPRTSLQRRRDHVEGI